MGIASRPKSKVEFGDFQTPMSLARAVARQVAASGFAPATIIEPSCGAGGLLFAATDEFPAFSTALGLEIQPRHMAAALERRAGRQDEDRITVIEGDFFARDWAETLGAVPDPLLVVGNPPWVTNAELAAIGSTNVPMKSNFQGRSGLDALTGKANFDISEAMLLRLIDALSGRDAMLAMLCKTAVARKVLEHGWKKAAKVESAEMYRIDSIEHFGASVDACLLMIRFGRPNVQSECRVFPSLGAKAHEQTLGFRDSRVLADAAAYDRWRHLQGEGPYRWRSGIKHDCSEVMELVAATEGLRTRGGEPLDLEREAVFPMLKASDLGNGKVPAPTRWMIVPQRTTGEDTSRLSRLAPNTWAYLNSHADRLDKRASVIYKGRPRFSVFGIGEYSFAPWKVAIAGLYKKLTFHVIGPHDGKPVVFDDTCYFVPCRSEREASIVASLLNSEQAREFFSAFIFWDAKRPITVDVLARLDIAKIAAEKGRLSELQEVMGGTPSHEAPMSAGSLWAK
ncbi:MAG: hypothetical protein K2W85_17335 [Phycisphaerales bacterium]|nr:hypothetical protein [Phycisphaerales bacterium]